MLHNQNVGVFSVTLGISDWANLKDALLINEKLEVPENAMHFKDKRVVVDRVVFDNLIAKRNDILKFATEKNENDAYLVSNLFVHLAGHEITELEPIYGNLSHLRSANLRLIHNCVWSRSFTETAQKELMKCFLKRTLPNNDCFLKKHLIFDSKQKLYFFKIDKERYKKFFNASASLSYLSFSLVDDEDYLCGKFVDWVKFIKSTVSMDLKERLCEIQQKEGLEKFSQGFMDKGDVKKSYFTSSQIAKMSKALISFRDKVVTNYELFKVFCGKNPSLQLQHFWGNIFTSINLELDVLKKKPNISREEFEKYFAKNHEIIDDILFLYDSKHVSNALGNYFEVKISLTKQEIWMLFDSIKTSQNEGLNHEQIWHKLGNIPESELLNLSKSYTKRLKEFDELLNFVKQNPDINSGEKIKEYVTYLENVSKVKISYSKGLAFCRLLTAFLRYIPVFSLFCAVLDPSKKTVQFLNQSKQFYGTKFSKSIRKSLNISKNFKHVKDILSGIKSETFVEKIKKKYCLISKKEKILLLFKSKKKIIKILLGTLICIMVVLYVCDVILKEYNVKKAGYVRLFEVNKIILELIVILFLINVLLEYVIKGLIFFIIVIIKYVDQFLFGRLVAKTVNLIKSIIIDVSCGVFNFFGDVCAFIIENGLRCAIIVALKNIRNSLTKETIKRVMSDFLDYVVDRFQAPIMQEDPYVITTYSFNIFNIVGSLKKIYNFFSYYKKNSHGHEVSALVRWVKEILGASNSAEGEKYNTTELCILLLHSQIMNVMLHVTNHQDLVRQLTDFCHNNDAFRNLLEQTTDEAIRILLQNNGFHINEYLQAVVWKRLMFLYPGLKLNNGITPPTKADNVARDFRIEAIDWCIKKLEIVNYLMEQHCRIFKYNNAHLVVQQALGVYKSILQNNTSGLSVQIMEALDDIFATYLNDAASIITELHNTTAASNVTTSSTSEFYKAFSGNLFMGGNNEGVKRVKKYIRSHYKKCSLVYDIPHIIQHGVKDLFSLTTLVSILLCQIPSLQMLLQKLDLKNITRVHELHHLTESFLEKSFATGALEIAESIEMLKSVGEMYEDWAQFGNIMTKVDFCMKEMGSGNSPDAKYIHKIKNFFNAALYQTSSLLQFNALEDLINSNKNPSPDQPSTKVSELLRLNNVCFEDMTLVV